MKKAYLKSKKGVCKVTFELPQEKGGETAHLVGAFNNWDQKATPMKRAKTGGFSVTLSLDAGKEYRFRYLLDGTRWENDPKADRQVPNEFGSEDSVIST